MLLKKLNIFLLRITTTIPIFTVISCGNFAGNPLSPTITQTMSTPTKKSIVLLPYLNIMVGFQPNISKETTSVIGKTLDTIRIIFHLPLFEDALQKFITGNPGNYSIILDEPSYFITKNYTTEYSYIGKLLYHMKTKPIKLTFFSQKIENKNDIFQFKNFEFDTEHGNKVYIVVNSSLQNKILETPMSKLILQLSQCVLESYDKTFNSVSDSPELLTGISKLFELFYIRNRTHPELSRILRGYRFYIEKFNIESTSQK